MEFISFNLPYQVHICYIFLLSLQGGNKVYESIHGNTSLHGRDQKFTDSIVAIKGGSCHFKGSSLSPFPLFSRISILGFPLHSRNSTTACWIVWNLLVLGLKALFPFLKDVCVGAKRRNHRRVTGKKTYPWSCGLSNTKTELNSGNAIS